MDRPQVSFTFPFRWLKGDRKFLKENIKRQILKNKNKNPMHSRLRQNFVHSYAVVITQHAFKPKSFKLTKTEVEDILDEVYPNAKCVEYDKDDFEKTRSRTALPVMEFKVYH